MKYHIALNESDFYKLTNGKTLRILPGTKAGTRGAPTTEIILEDIEFSAMLSAISDAIRNSIEKKGQSQ